MIVDTMKIKAIAPWFGGKRTLAPRIAAELGKHSFYYEPFGGGAAVLFAKEPSSHEVFNDLHRGLVNLAMVIASERYTDLCQRAVRILHCDALYESIRDRVEQETCPVAKSPESVCNEHVEAALDYLAAWWLGRNGTAGTERKDYQMAHRHTPGGGAGPIRWRGVIESLPAWHLRLMNVDIRCEDAYQLTPKMADVPEMAIYADPTYLRQGARSGGCRYRHELSDHTGTLLESSDDHARLAQMLRKFKHARIVVSYYDHPRIRDLYAGWTVVDCTMQKNLHVQNRRGSSMCEAPEVLLINGPSYTEGVS